MAGEKALLACCLLLARTIPMCKPFPAVVAIYRGSYMPTVQTVVTCTYTLLAYIYIYRHLAARVYNKCWQ